MLSGVMPAMLGDATDLKSINLGMNNITGTIPSSLGQLQGLEYLSMPHNSLHSSLPHEVSHLDLLRTINFNSNQLSGSLPDFSSLKRLQNLILSGNVFTGTVPDAMLLLDKLGTFVG